LKIEALLKIVPRRNPQSEKGTNDVLDGYGIYLLAWNAL